MLLSLAPVGSRAREVAVAVDRSVTYQPILGWGASIFLEDKERLGPELQPKLLELFVGHLGCNAFRWEISRRDWEYYANDNDDPDRINWAAFKPADCDARARDVILPMKAMVEARGEKLSLYSSSSFFMETEDGTVPEWMLQSPAEMSEWLVAHLLYIKGKHGITVDRICVVNEPDNHNRFNAVSVGNMIKTLGPRLEKEGLDTTILFPEHAAVNGAVDYIKQWQNDPEVMNYVSGFSYHLYFETSYDIPDKREIYRLAQVKNIPVAQTEFMWVDFGILHDDLTNGGVSYWFTYWDKDYVTLNSSKTSFSLKQTYWDIRQVLKYVKQGSFRISATTDAPDSTRVMAFARDGDVVVVCNNKSLGEGADFKVSGLPAGTYAVNKGKLELGLHPVGPQGILSLSLEAGEIATVYPTKGINQAPLVAEWGASPSYLQMPAATTTLGVTVSDQEADRITYRWLVKKQPEGANVVLAHPDQASTGATGLTVAGDYEFAVTIGDGTNTVVQELVPVRVVAGNQPPVVYGMENRMSAYPHLPGNTKTTLGCVAYDPEGDPVSLRWTVESQPAGANAGLSKADASRCDVTGMNVAGDYVFLATAQDENGAGHNRITITVRPENHTPVIGLIRVAPAKLVLPVTSTTLSADITDADGEIPGCWWTTEASPTGSNPQFSHQGRSTTRVGGLTRPGTYVFKLMAADNHARIYRDVTVQVAAAESVQEGN